MYFRTTPSVPIEILATRTAANAGDTNCRETHQNLLSRLADESNDGEFQLSAHRTGRTHAAAGHRRAAAAALTSGDFSQPGVTSAASSAPAATPRTSPAATTSGNAAGAPHTAPSGASEAGEHLSKGMSCLLHHLCNEILTFKLTYRWETNSLDCGRRFRFRGAAGWYQEETREEEEEVCWKRSSYPADLSFILTHRSYCSLKKYRRTRLWR